jgi:monofunctional biosynthetic peptidoglycan transglycosylase
MAMVRRILRRLFFAAIILAAIPVVLSLLYTVVTPVSTRMAWRTVTFQGVTRTPVALSDVARNLFLWQGDTGLTAMARKAMEIPLAMLIDLVWSKRRMMEIYLNIAEWGPNGEFGIEAGSQRAFRKRAAALSAGEAALLVSILPNPIRRSASAPGTGVRRKAAIIARRAGAADTSCL